jgi:hypothetical protein
MSKKRKGLRPSQKRAIQALLFSPNVKSAAANAKVGYRTLTRWLKEDTAFREELSGLQRTAVDQTLMRLAQTSGEALSVTRAVMLSIDTGPATRLHAAEVILGKLLPLKDAQLEDRLDRIEALLSALDKEDGNEKA